MSHIVFPADYGVMADGVSDDSSALQTAATAAAGKILFLPDGQYLLDTHGIKIPSETIVRGESHRAVLVAGANIVANTDFIASHVIPENMPGPQIHMLSNSNMHEGNQNIVLENFSIDMSQLNPIGSPAEVCVHFRRVSGFRITRLRTSGGQDGISATRSRNFRVECCYTANHRNAHIDCWGGCANGLVSRNVINGDGTNDSYGVLVTGIDTDGTALTARNVLIENNIIQNLTDAGIWLQGARITSSGFCVNCQVTKNIISNVAFYVGIKSTSGGGHLIYGNRIINIARAAIVLTTEHGGTVLAPANCKILDNVISNVSQSAPGKHSAIVIGSPNGTSDGNIISKNQIFGDGHKFGIESFNVANQYNVLSENEINNAKIGEIFFPGEKNCCF